MALRKSGSIVLLAIGVATGAAVVFACGFDPPEKNPNPPSGAGGACSAEPGAFPNPDCDNSANECTEGAVCSDTKTTACCKIDPRCGDQSTCMPLSDNKGKSVLDLRMRRLNIAVPASLAEPFIQNVVVTKNLDLKANGKGGTPQCAEDGVGAFNWLLKVDKTANTMTTGGAPPVDKFTDGFCFYKQQRRSILVESATAKIKFTGDTFDADPIPKLNVPIFVGGNKENVVILPITDATIKGVTISEGGNCVGKFNPSGVKKACDDDPSSCQKWKTAGSLGGYLTLEEADTVEVKDLNKTLCLVLTKASPGPDGKSCPRGADGKINLQGDYCSTSKKKGDCADSFWLAATFAASAAVITDGATVPECQGKSSTDAGSDVSVDAPADVSQDAPADVTQDAPADAPSEGG